MIFGNKIVFFRIIRPSNHPLIHKSNLPALQSSRQLFVLQEPLFTVYAGGVAGEVAVGGYDAVTGDYERYGVVGDGGTYGLGGSATEAMGYMAVWDGGAVWDFTQAPPDTAAEMAASQ